jgi:hypothetical protein
MPTTTRLRGPALSACPHCGADKKSYAQHWAKSASCRYPRVDEAQHALVAGLLLGDGSLEGRANAKLRIETTQRAFAEWMYDELDWLAHGLAEQRGDGLDSDAVYRVVTLAHPDLNRYRDWYHDDVKRPPSGVRLTPRFARALHACDGTLSFGPGDRPHVEFRAGETAYAEWLQTALADWRVPATASNGRVRILSEDVGEWLATVGPAVPGVEHKWATDRDEYERLRDE